MALGCLISIGSSHAVSTPEGALWAERADRWAQPETSAFLEKAEDLLRLSLRGFEKERKAYATLAIGCTGGRHRSVALVQELAERLGRDVSLSVRHRDLSRTV